MSFNDTLLDWLLRASFVAFFLSTAGLAIASWITILWMDRSRRPSKTRHA